ncbi:MAG TPA: hypothetical protein VJC12_00430 [Candidatus Paceibacterota bacterium]
MWKLFDNTFFKFLFGFLVILAISILILFAAQYWSKKGNPDSTYVQVSSQ